MISTHLKPPPLSNLLPMLNIKPMNYIFDENLRPMSPCQYFTSNPTSLKAKSSNQQNSIIYSQIVIQIQR